MSRSSTGRSFRPRVRNRPAPTIQDGAGTPAARRPGNLPHGPRQLRRHLTLACLAVWACVFASLTLGLATPLANAARAADLPGTAPAGPLRLIFTAETRGNLVPCECPGQPYGGLAQRSEFVRVGGLAETPTRPDGRDREPATLAHLPATGSSGAGPVNVLRLHAGGFLPVGDVPLRRDVNVLRRYLALLLEDLDHARFDAVAVGSEELAFLLDQNPGGFREDDPRWMIFGRADVRVVPWDGYRVAVIALDAAWPAEALRARVDAAREAADWVIVLSRANGATGRRIAEAAHPDLIILSQGASLERPLQHEGTWMVGAGTHGRYVGQCDLIVEDGRLAVTGYARVPIDAGSPTSPGLLEKTRALIRDGHPDWYAHISSDP